MTGKPAVRPARPFFSSGPCAKRPGRTPEAVTGALLGRSHRSAPGKAKLKEAIDRTHALLRVPGDFRVAIVPASDTGAVEMAMWNLLGPRPVNVFAWESFGQDWVTDTVRGAQRGLWRTTEAEPAERPGRGICVERHHQRCARAGWQLDPG